MVGCTGTIDDSDPNVEPPENSPPQMVTIYGKVPSDGNKLATPLHRRSGWDPMEDRGSITQNHYDHVHVSFEETGP